MYNNSSDKTLQYFCFFKHILAEQLNTPKSKFRVNHNRESNPGFCGSGTDLRDQNKLWKWNPCLMIYELGVLTTRPHQRLFPHLHHSLV